MRDHDDLPYIVIERHSAGFGAFFWGALIGAGAALLLAPRSGAETQAEIRHGVRRARTAAEDRMDAARSTVNRTRDRIEEQIGSVRDQFGSVRDQIGSVRDRFESRAAEARHAFETGRERARDEIERRFSDTREGSYDSGPENLGSAEDELSGTRRVDADVVITEMSQESIEGRTDLG